MKIKEKMLAKNYIALALFLVVLGCMWFPMIFDAVNSREICYVTDHIEKMEIRSSRRGEIAIFVDKQRYDIWKRDLDLHEDFPSLGLSAYEVLCSIVENKDVITVGYLNYGFHRRIVSISKDGIHYLDDRALYWKCVIDLYLFATISLVCTSIGIRMLIRYRQIYRKKQ